MRRWTFYRLGLYSSFISFLALKHALAITCFICGQSNVPPPGECSTQFQYDCNTVDPNQPQLPPRSAVTKMICRTTRSRLSANVYSVGKECVSEDEHLNRYPDGKAFGCDTLYPNTTNEVSYCVCDQDLCNNRSISEQMQLQFIQASLLTDRSVNISLAAPFGSNNIPIFPQQPWIPIVQGGHDRLLPAPLLSPTSLPVNINTFGRTPPGTDPASIPVQGSDHGGILVPPLILPNNSIPLPPYPSTLPPPVVSARGPDPPNGLHQQQTRGSTPRNSPEQRQPVVAAAAGGGRPLPIEETEKDGELPFDEVNIAEVAQPSGGLSTVQGIAAQHQLKQGLNWTSLEQVRRENVANFGESFIDQSPVVGGGRNAWPIQTVQNHLVAEQQGNRQQQQQQLQNNNQDQRKQQVAVETINTPRNSSNPLRQIGAESVLKCVACAETNLTSGTDCRKQIVIDCSRQFSAESKVFCFTKETVLLSGLRTVEKRCASGESLVEELGLQVIRESCGQTRPQSPQEFRYCICSSSDSCNQISLQQQLVLYANLVQSPQVPNPWIQNQQQQLAGGFTQQVRQTTSVQKTTTLSNGPDVRCYVCGESDLQHAADCSQQYEYNCHQQYPPNLNAKILCLTRQTKLATGLFSIEKRCIAESEHKLQYPGSQVVLDGCGEAWNGYVQYCVCAADAELCNGPNITVQQQNRGYTPTDLHQLTDPFTTLPVHRLSSSSTAGTQSYYKRNQTTPNRRITSLSSLSSIGTTENFKSTTTTTTTNDKKQPFVDEFFDHQKKTTSSKQANWERQKSQQANGGSSKNCNFLNNVFIHFSLLLSFLFTIQQFHL